MNTRRQTVWLVSMLGLMVVLSAYYLFTDEADQLPGTPDTAQSEILLEGVGMMDPTAASESMTALDGEQAVAETDPADSAETAGEAVTDAEVLEQVMKQTGSDAVTAMQIQRSSDFSRQFESLTAAMTKEDATEQEITEVINKHNALMDLEAKLIAFEEKLLGDYENVAVMYDDQREHFTVHVSAAQLEKSEAVSIVTEAMRDLNIAIHQITVKQYN